MKWNKGKTIAVEIIALILFASLMGCNKNYHVPESQADAGSVHIAVLSVAPWDKYVEDLQPTFDMTTENALKEVIPTTGIIDEKIIDALGAGLKLALPTASVTSTSTVTSETGRETISKTSATKEKKSGDVSAVKGGELSLPEKKPSDISHPSEGVDIDPMTKYLAATALYQEVKLLNRYIKDAAVYCDECTPYVVRLQISLMPKVRNLPYDAYTTISFFDGSQVPKITSDDFGKLKVEWPTGKTNPPFVIPLLVTDNLESILRSSSEDKIRNYTVALSALISGVGLGGNFEKKLDKLKNQKGKDLNSLLTIAKVTENTLRVRLGARQVSGLGDEDHFAMAPRTHNITVLLMVPNDKNGDKDGKKKDGKKRVEVLALTSMVHATEGKELMRRSPKDLAPVIEKLLKSFRANASQPTTSYKAAPVPSTANTDQMDIVEMITYIEMNQWNDFLKKCQKSFNNLYCNTIWLELASLLVGSEYSTSSFYLPSIQTPKLFPNQTVLLLDDTTDKTTVILKDGENLLSTNISAMLYMDSDEKGAKKASSSGEDGKCRNIENHYPLISENVVIAESGKKATFSFPSLKAWGFDKNLGPQKGDNKLEITYKTEKVCLEKVLYIEKPQPTKKAPGFTLKVTTSSIIATKDGRGTLQVSIKKSKDNPPAKIFYDVEGADIEKTTSKPSNIFVDDGKGEPYVNSDGTVTFSLKNLKDNSMVAFIYSAGDKDSSVKVTVPVEMTK